MNGIIWQKYSQWSFYFNKHTFQAKQKILFPHTSTYFYSEYSVSSASQVTRYDINLQCYLFTFFRKRIVHKINTNKQTMYKNIRSMFHRNACLKHFIWCKVLKLNKTFLRSQEKSIYIDTSTPWDTYLHLK